MKKFIALTLALIMSLSCFSLISFAEETKTTEHLTEVPEGYNGVYTIEDLYCVRNDLTANYILMNDIDLSEATSEGGDWNYGGRGWNPIGSNDVYDNNAFSGVFDGNGYSVTGININITSFPSGSDNYKYIGLFSYLTGTIMNLNVDGKIVINSRVRSSDKSDYYTYIGGIVASCGSTGIIKNCTNNIIIDQYLYSYATYSAADSWCYVGGIAGVNAGTIENCANYANIDATFESYWQSNNRVGGITGAGSVNNCLNSGNVTTDSKGNAEIGYDCIVHTSGISNTGTITNCYNMSAITYKSFYESYSAGVSYEGYTENCYNIGTVFCGYGGTSYNYAINSSTKGNNKSYYLEGVGSNSKNAVSLTEAQMKLQSMYSGWDFDTVWTMDGREDYPYPELRNVPLVLADDYKTEIKGTVTVTGEVKVGSTLTAEITDVSPADATFEYEWKADGVVVGTASTYTVTQDDVGKEITLTVKGNGDFKGEFSSSAIIGECVHSLGEYTNNNDSTCETNETKYAVCEKCGETVTEEIENTKLPHTFTNYVYDENATCTADGTKTAKCEYCNATDTLTAKNTMVEHTFSDSWVIDKEATCAEEGIKSHHCKNCNATKDETVLNKLAHIYASKVTEATCDKDGEVVYTCSCGDSYSKIIYATGHKDNDGNGRCDECPEYVEGDKETEGENNPDCKCICHEKGIHDLLYRIFSYIQRYFKIDLLGKIFKLGQTCKCGEYHY